MFSSCTNNNSGDNDEKAYYFDEQSLLEAKSKWNLSGLKNYSFNYSISDVEPNSIIGQVNVIDGIGNVELSVNGLTTNDEIFNAECLRYEKLGRAIKFTTIDEIFDFIEKLVKKRKFQLETNKLSYYEMNIIYNEKCIPISISETILALTPSEVDGDSNGEFYMQISNFLEFF